MPVITLSTDFGAVDEYVGAMKGVILTLYPSVTIVDVTHELPAHDVRYAAHALAAFYRFFPRDTVHVVVVDPGVGTDRRILAVETDVHTFIAPDNGVLTAVMAREPLRRIVSVENPAYFQETVSRTFHGRDVFSPVAAWVSKGVDIARIGPAVKAGETVRLSLPKPQKIDDRTLTGTVTMVDRFGNLTTNIDADTLAGFVGATRPENVSAAIKGHRIHGLSNTYASAGTGEPLMIVGSRDYLEIAVNRGSARRHFNAAEGESLSLTLTERSTVP